MKLLWLVWGGWAMAAPAVYPPQIQLFGAGAEQTVATDGTACGMTVADRAVAELVGRRVVAKGRGATWLTVKCASGLATVPVTVRAAGAAVKKSYVNDIAPIFTLAGCTGSNCHGSVRGQRGLQLSLFGQKPEADFEAIAKWIDKTAAEKSLILAKATAAVEHGGGVRFAADSMEYRTIVEWIREGAALEAKDTPRLTELRVYPKEQILYGKEAQQQLVAVGYYSDGTVRDATATVQYISNRPDLVQVSGTGVARARQTGEAAVMVRTMGRAAAARILVAESRPGADYPRVTRNHFVDEHVFGKLQRLNIRPSELSGDGEFLRRVYLDTIGKLPAEEEARAFLASKDAGKRRAVIDGLVARPEFAEMWALQFARLTRAGAKDGRTVYEQLRRSFAENQSYDKLVTKLLLSPEGRLSETTDYAAHIGRIFLGVRIDCAKCHNHPWEKWTRDDFYGFAAFFAPGAATPKYLDGGLETGEQGKDIREALARWMTRPDNPFFARAIVNRVWKHFMGRGLVEEVDDFRVTNPPANPALLDALAGDFVKNRFDFRRLVKMILSSRAYQLSGTPNESNRGDTMNYSRYQMRRPVAEALMDAIAQVTGVPDRFAGYPPGTRAMQVFSGRSEPPSEGGRESVCLRDVRPERARAADGDTIEAKLAAMADWEGDVAERLYLRTLTRYPTAGERAALEKALAAGSRKKVLQEALRAVMMSEEFLFNH